MWWVLIIDSSYDFMDFGCKELEAVLYVAVVVFILFEIVYLMLKTK